MSNITAVITQEAAKLSCNFDQVETAIREKLSEYDGAVFTEESKTYAKKEVASLREQKKNLQDSLRDAKKQYMAPWDALETRAKELIGLYDKPIDLISGQIQAFEEDRIAKKRELIRSIYEELVPPELLAYIPEERIHNPKWENATFREKDIRSEISDTVTRVRRDVAMISGMDSEAVPDALEKYRGSLDLSEAVSFVNAYERQKLEIIAREQERKRREEEDRIRREEREKMLAEQRMREELEEAARRAEYEKQEALKKAEEEKEAAINQAVEQAKEDAAQEVLDSFIPEAGTNEDAELYEYRMALSSSEKEKLEMFMDSIGIEWEVIS